MSMSKSGILDKIRGEPQSASVSPSSDNLAAGLYQTYVSRGITGVERVRGRISGEYIAYRDGSTMIVSDEICPYETPNLQALALWASRNPKLAYVTVHEAEERPGPASHDGAIHSQVHVDALNDLAALGYSDAVRAGVELGNQFSWGAGVSYDRLDEALLGGPSYALRPTGQPALPGGIIAGPGSWAEYFVNELRVAFGKLQDPNSDTVYGPLSVFSNAMKPVAVGFAPISKLGHTGFIFTLGPRGESEFATKQEVAKALSGHGHPGYENALKQIAEGLSKVGERAARDGGSYRGMAEAEAAALMSRRPQEGDLQRFITGYMAQELYGLNEGQRDLTEALYRLRPEDPLVLGIKTAISNPAALFEGIKFFTTYRAATAPRR